MPKPTFTQSSLKDILIRNLGKISHLAQIAEGEESRAFSVRASGEDYVVRINQTADGFKKDAFAYEWFSSPTLPIPEIVTLGEFGNGHTFCISRMAQGVTLQSLSDAELPAVVGPVASVMDAIAHSNIEATSGFGRFDALGVGVYETWHDFLIGITKHSQYNWSAVGQAIDMGRVYPLLNEVLELAWHCPEVRQLVHGDFGSNNVLTDGKRITGVIDWSEAMFGDPLYDIANILFWRGWLECMEQQACFFETQCPDRVHHKQRIRCYLLRIGLEEIFQNAICGTAENVAYAIDRCEEL